MASKGHWLIRQVKELMDFANHLYTFLAFITFCFLVPSIIGLYIVVNSSRRFWLGLLKRRFPKLEFVKNVTVRTATDTMRNQGIITLLLTVKGKFDPEVIKERLRENMLKRRDKEGKLMFPHLQTVLTTRWGCYAWDNISDFSLDNHLVVGNPLFRGRIVSDFNIQEYLSDIVAKYLPPELPPWQITIIPSFIGQEERFYLLIRIHHLLLSEEGLGLGDLLLLGSDRPVFKKLLDEDDENPKELPLNISPLTGLVEKPVAIPNLYYCFRNCIMNHWNQLVASYDPIENPEVFKSRPGIQICTAVVVITGLSICKELFLLTRRTDISLYRKILNINRIILEEVDKRQCTLQFLAAGILNSLRPSRVLMSSLSWFWCIIYTCSVTIPLIVLYEIQALLTRNKNKGFYKTITEITFSYWAMITVATKEVLYIWSIIYTAPRMMLEELIITHRDPKHQLQTVSLCGRKVVAWSDPLPLDFVRRIGFATGALPSEVLISAVAGALREYFRLSRLPVPESVLATARYFPLESLLQTSRDVDGSAGPPSGRGLICLALPTSQLHADPRDSVQEVQRILCEARERQPAIYQASLWQLDGGYITRLLPSLAVRLVINHLSRRYAVTLTEVLPEIPDETHKKLIWGQEVESAMYWRPPQSNICLSLTLMSYGESVRLGIMSDSMIAPQHTVLSTNFLQQIYQLAAVSGVPRDRSSFSTTSSSSHVYHPNIPPEGTISAHGSNTSASSASEELRRLASSSPELNVSTSTGTSRSNTPESGMNGMRTLNEEHIFPFTD